MLSIVWMVPALTLVAQQPFDTLRTAPSAVAAQPPVESSPIAGGQNITEEIACAPMNADAPPLGGLRVSGGMVHGRIMFGPGEPLVVNAGAKQGLQKGQMYYVRRHVRDLFTPALPDFTPVSIHTAGWVTIIDVKDEVAVAQVTHACDGILDDDYLEPYTEPVAPSATFGGEPDFDHPARIVMADEKMQSASAGTMMLINRGSDAGVRAGQTLTIFRSTLAGAGPTVDVGRATVLSVRPRTALIRVDTSHDAVYVGDLAALHQIKP
jgi:hypothetical protein